MSLHIINLIGKGVESLADWSVLSKTSFQVNHHSHRSFFKDVTGNSLDKLTPHRGIF